MKWNIEFIRHFILDMRYGKFYVRRIRLILMIFLFIFLSLLVTGTIYFYFRSSITLIIITLTVFLLSYLTPLWFILFLGAKRYEGTYRKRLMDIAHNHTIFLKELYIKNGETSYACAFGFAHSASVCYDKITLDNHPQDEIEAVMAHELGHHYNGDIYLYTAIIAIFLVVGIKYMVSVSQNNWFIVLYVSFLLSVILLPLFLAISRWREGKADTYAKEHLKDPTAFARFFERCIANDEKKGIFIPTNQSWLHLFSTHSWVYDRIQMMRSASK